jgi:hypothetical protein
MLISNNLAEYKLDVNYLSFKILKVTETRESYVGR